VVVDNVTRVAASVVGLGLMAASLAAQAPAKIAACSLMTKAEVKQALGTVSPVWDLLPPEEEPAGRGSSCNYPGLMLQVDPFSIDAFRQVKGVQPVSGIGDEAYFRDNKAGYAELALRTGSHVVTLQLTKENEAAVLTAPPGPLVAVAKLAISKLK
jgi:hypothetical protein